MRVVSKLLKTNSPSNIFYMFNQQEEKEEGKEEGKEG